MKNVVPVKIHKSYLRISLIILVDRHKTFIAATGGLIKIKAR
jgi:hypothetical protein